MDNEEIYCNKLIIFEIIITIIVLFMFLFFIINISKDNKKEEYQESTTTESLFISQPVSEKPQIANFLQESKILTHTFCYEGKKNVINFCISNDTEIIEENIVNPYTEIIKNLTEYEKELIYKITFAEAGNQEEDGQRAVIEVILNRVLSDDFPNTVEGVLSQKNQFSTWPGRNKIRKIDQDRIINILELVAIEIPILPSLEYVFFARGKQTKYATDFIKIQDHWFGATK